jgi:hypothetical protein
MGRLSGTRYRLHQAAFRLRGRSPLDRDESRSRHIYPDAAGVGLSVPLQKELDRIGSTVQASWPDPLALWSGAERRERSAQVGAAAEQRAFTVSLWAEGVEHLTGLANGLSFVAAAFDAWLSNAQPGAEEMAEHFPFLSFQKSARAYERGDAIEEVWLSLLKGAWGIERLQPLVEAAAAEPRLRQLRPWVSVDRLCFSRWVGFPFSDDLPYAAPRGSFRVYKPHPGEYLSERSVDVLGEGDPERAVELLVAALPDPLDVVYRRPPSA